MRYDSIITVKQRAISLQDPTYFVADIAANHDGDLQRAMDLIWKAKEAGADAAKFQHFLAKDIVSDYGFRKLGGQLGHQAKWDKPVVSVYRQYELNRDWNEALFATCEQAGIDFMTTPYDFAATESVARLVAAIKIGSGDITWTDSIAHIAAQGKPVFLATGASTMEDAERAVATILDHTPQIVLMQCNTNYTGDVENFRFINLRVLQNYAIHWPGMVLGLSDHTPGHATVLGALALGARVIEKHFTDDSSRAGPDHPFSMTPQSWREMVDRSRELENALGDGVKRIEENERQTAVVQRRCLRLVHAMKAGEVLAAGDLEALRPADPHALPPYRAAEAVGRVLTVDKEAGDALHAHEVEGIDA
ncbi:N-acetylneuraminate synthase family protein [Azospirillum sp. sgz301742]